MPLSAGFEGLLSPSGQKLILNYIFKNGNICNLKASTLLYILLADAFVKSDIQ